MKSDPELASGERQPSEDAPPSGGSRPPLAQRAVARRVRQAVILAVIMFTSLGLYLVVLRWRGPDAALETHTAWDDAIPFRPEWVWIYLLPYVVGPPLFLLMTPATFRWFVGRGLAVLFISLAIFIAMPTRTAPRPPASDRGDWTGTLYHSMTAIDDPPANAAPSLHVSLSCLLAIALLRDFPRWWAVTLGGVGLVWLATVFTRQHHLIDVVTGVLLALLVAWAWPVRGQPKNTGDANAG